MCGSGCVELSTKTDLYQKWNLVPAKNSTEDKMEMDSTSAREDLNTDVYRGLLNPPINVVHIQTGQEFMFPSSASKQISLENKIMNRDPTGTEWVGSSS